ncbi:PREDICTED: thioredoxin-1-like [Prunus mume]|uniref:Thioredoxin-1-like n=1 Tax=Prunus mume TaxID=102107 RepID=A0ABM0N9E5_PRUMU|nr:PREDICTED: thioredoxin-1-like [Prunus mume]
MVKLCAPACFSPPLKLEPLGPMLVLYPSGRFLINSFALAVRAASPTISMLIFANRSLYPIFSATVLGKKLAKKNPKVTFLKVDVDELKTVSEKWGVDAVPTFLFLKEGKAVDKVVGAKKDELRTKVEKHAAAASRIDDTSRTGAIAKATATASNSATVTATTTSTAGATLTATPAAA